MHTSFPVLPVPVSHPQVLSIDMDGEEEEGGVLVGYYSYKGGHEGESLLQWFRYPVSEQLHGCVNSCWNNVMTSYACNVERLISKTSREKERDVTMTKCGL